MFCWETSVPVIHVDVILTPTSVLLKTTSAFNKNDTPAGCSRTKKTRFRNGWKRVEVCGTHLWDSPHKLLYLRDLLLVTETTAHTRGVLESCF